MPTNVSNIIVQGTANTAALSLLNSDTLNLFPTGFILAYGTGASPGVQAAGSNVFNIAGNIFSTQYVGINVASGGNVFNIGPTATIFGLGAAILVNGGSNVFSNSGDVGSSGPAVQFTAGSTTFNNSGNIISADFDGVYFVGGTNTITNAGYIAAGGPGDALQCDGTNNTVINTGTLNGVQAVDFDSVGGVNALFNAGTMIGTGGDGYDGDDGQDFITNNGLIQGVFSAVDMEGGNDVYDGRNGTIVGAIRGGDGNDIILGGVAGEVLQGGAGNDLITGGVGGDVLQGGLDADLFIFNLGDNGDLIQAFNDGGIRDGLDLRGYFDATGFAGTNPRAAGILQVLQNGADTDVFLHGAFAFRIQGVAAAAIAGGSSSSNARVACPAEPLFCAFSFASPCPIPSRTFGCASTTASAAVSGKPEAVRQAAMFGNTRKRTSSSL
jgi:Ca2+-binding RTX toxin-like protein